MDIALEILSWGLLFVGSAFLVIGGIGVVRLPDVFTRMHGAGIIDTMGVGGVMALGCTIGQGITGMSTLALGSLIALISIIAGGVVGMKYIEEGSLAGALSAMFSHGG